MEFKIEKVKNLKHTNTGSIAMEVKFEHMGMFIPFNACKDDSESHGRELYENALAGKYGEISPPDITDEEYKSRFIKSALQSDVHSVDKEISVLRDANELGIITAEEKKRFDDLRTYRVQATRLINAPGVLKGIIPSVPVK